MRLACSYRSASSTTQSFINLMFYDPYLPFKISSVLQSPAIIYFSILLSALCWQMWICLPDANMASWLLQPRWCMMLQKYAGNQTCSNIIDGWLFLDGDKRDWHARLDSFSDVRQFRRKKTWTWCAWRHSLSPLKKKCMNERHDTNADNLKIICPKTALVTVFGGNERCSYTQLF